MEAHRLSKLKQSRAQNADFQHVVRNLARVGVARVDVDISQPGGRIAASSVGWLSSAPTARTSQRGPALLPPDDSVCSCPKPMSQRRLLDAGLEGRSIPNLVRLQTDDSILYHQNYYFDDQKSDGDSL